jgi:spore maturation protein CgeB
MVTEPGGPPTASPFRPKVMVVGDYMWPWYQQACANALESLGCSVVRLGWFGEFWHWVSDHTEPVYNSFWRRLQFRLHAGPAVWRAEKSLLRAAGREKPDVVFFYNVTLFGPATVQKLKRLLPNAVLCQYSNDNPFSADARPGLWNKYLKSIPFFDVSFAFRSNNIDDYFRHGARRVELLRAYFIPEDEYPVPEAEVPDRFKCDVVFAGHYENDGRVEFLEAICDAGFKLNLFGGGWQAALGKLRPDSPLRNNYPVMPATGADYRYALCGAKVALCFLSTLNRDTYTRRNFQIPAMKVAMLSQHTGDLAALFREDVDACFFRNKREMLEKIKWLVGDDFIRNAIAESGYRKVRDDNHSVVGRMALFLSFIQGKSE